MKKILLSLSTISAVAILAVVGTTAYFTDEEKSEGNSFTAGTIDIAVDGQNPWTQSETLNVVDMKPSQHEYTEYVIKNVGTNPANVWKKIDVKTQEEGTTSEPECVAYGGTWTNPNGPCTGGTPKNDIATVIRYDMSVWVYNVDPKTNPSAQPVWWQVIYTDEMGKMLSAVNGQNILLGMIPEGWYMKVQQSYHMDKDTGNWAQGDKLTFDITLKAEQLTNTLVLENKDFANGPNPTIIYDGTQATFTYGVKDAKLNYTLAIAGMTNGNYTLIAWDDTANGYAWNWANRGNAIALANVTVAGGIANKTDSIDLNKDLINAKVWLIPGTYAPGTSPGSFGWTPSQMLFDTALMDYYDSL